MGIKIFLALCVLGEIFLLYVLVHFVREAQTLRTGVSHERSSIVSQDRKVIQMAIYQKHVPKTKAPKQRTLTRKRSQE